MATVSHLLSQLNSTELEKERAKLLCSIAWELRTSEPDRAIEYANQSLQLARNIQCSQSIRQAVDALGTIYKNKGNYEEAKNYYNQALQIAKANPRTIDISATYCNLGIVHTLQGDFENGSEFFFKALRIGEKNDNKKIISNAYNNLGLLFELQNDFDTALTYHKKSLENYKEVRNSSGMAYAYNNTANVYKNMGEYRMAQSFYFKALSILELTGDKYGMAHSYCWIGEVYLTTKKYNLALDFLFKALNIQEEISDRRGQAETLKNISNVYIKQRKPTGALAFSKRSLEVAQEIGAKSRILDAYKSLSDSYQMINKHRKAYEYYVSYVKIKEALFNEEKTKTINNLHSKYEAEKKDQQIAQLNKEQELLQKMNEDLKEFTSKASHDLKEPLRMINSFSDLLETRYSSKLDQAGIEFVSMIKNSSERMRQLLEDLLEYAVAGIKPENLELVDLNETLKQVTNNLYLTIKETEAVIESDQLPAIQSFGAGMIQLFQNLISNSIKFAKEDINPIIKILAGEEGENYTLTFIDNGIGIEKKNQQMVFDIFHRIHPKNKYEGTGIGLATCKRIVENLGGTIRLESEENEGTTFFITFPKEPLSLRVQKEALN